MYVEHRVRSEVPDAGLEGDAAVRLDDEEAVEADRAARVGADRDADAARQTSLLLAADRRLLRVPLEQLVSFVERFLDERARDIGLLAVRQRGPERRVAGRGVDPADLHLIEPELFGGLREDRLEQADPLRAARRALRRLRRSVGQHCQT